MFNQTLRFCNDYTRSKHLPRIQLTFHKYDAPPTFKQWQDSFRTNIHFFSEKKNNNTACHGPSKSILNIHVNYLVVAKINLAGALFLLSLDEPLHCYQIRIAAGSWA